MKSKKTIIPVLYALSLMAALNSCRILHPYQPPLADTEELFRDEQETDTMTIASIPWREYFTDPLLRILISEGLSYNYDLAIAYTRIVQAEANLAMARGTYFPTVALAASVDQSRLSNGTRGKDILGYQSTQYGLGFTVTWEADLWGKLRGQSRAQFAQLLNSYAYKNLIQTTLIANIATTYYTLLALDEQLKITLETIELLKESAETMEALMEAGNLTAAAVEQSNALLYSTQVTVPDLINQIRQTENSLCQLTGRKPGPINRGALAYQQLNINLKHGIPLQMVARRPDVQQAELAFRAAFELTNVARASFYPSLQITTGTNIGYGATTLSHFFKPENILATFIGSLTQPIFYNRQLTGNLKLTKAEQEEALLTFHNTVLEAGIEVSNILFAYRSSLSKNDIRKEQLISLFKAVNYTQELLKAGEANYTEVLTAEQNLLAAQLDQVNDKLEQLEYSVTLYKALGGGVE